MTKNNTRLGRTLAAILCVLAPVSAAAAAGNAVSESDQFFLNEAETTCSSGDFSAFLWPFANSRLVRERYSAPTIRTGVAGSAVAVPVARYLDADDFPVVMIDFTYVTGASARQFDAPGGGDPRQLVPVQVDFNISSGGIERVDWAPGRFEPGEGDGPGTLIERTGPGGYLIFERTADCWRLTADIRNPASAR